jgi:rhamnulokinase
VHGRWTWDAAALRSSILDGLRAAAADGPVDSIGIDTWGVDYGLLDAQGGLVRDPVAYRDPRTREPFASLRATLGDATIYGATGIQFQPFNTLYQLAADAADPDRPLERAARMLLMPDLVAHWLCGSVACERTNASTTQMLDAKDRGWNGLLARAAGVPSRLLPELVDAGDTRPLGTLRAEIAAATGLPAATPVVATATHDTAAAVAGAPIDPASDLYVSSGTWSLVGLELPQAIVSEAARRANATNELGAFGSVRFLRNVAGLWLVQQCEEAFEREGRTRSWAELAALAEASPSLASVIDPDDPALFEPGDMPARIRAACVARGEPVPDSDAALVRCALDSVALATARAARALATIAGRTPRRVVIVGGGSANDLLNRLVADATGLPVETGPVECTAIGNALLQHAALEGVRELAPLRELVRKAVPPRRFEPDPARHARMREADARRRR